MTLARELVDEWLSLFVPLTAFGIPTVAVWWLVTDRTGIAWVGAVAALLVLVAIALTVSAVESGADR